MKSIEILNLVKLLKGMRNKDSSIICFIIYIHPILYFDYKQIVVFLIALFCYVVINSYVLVKHIA